MKFNIVQLNMGKCSAVEFLFLQLEVLKIIYTSCFMMLQQCHGDSCILLTPVAKGETQVGIVHQSDIYSCLGCVLVFLELWPQVECLHFHID